MTDSTRSVFDSSSLSDSSSPDGDDLRLAGTARVVATYKKSVSCAGQRCVLTFRRFTGLVFVGDDSGNSTSEVSFMSFAFLLVDFRLVEGMIVCVSTRSLWHKNDSSHAVASI